MTGQVQGKVALVTGGASGIGEAICELLAREGASVAVTDVDDLKGPEVTARIKKAGGETATGDRGTAGNCARGKFRTAAESGIP